jgi:transcriptional regulator with XRE-family HTH domain
MPIQPESIAEEVRALLARRKLSQRSLAQMLGWQQSQVSRRLSGNTPITASELSELADALNVTVESLYGRPSGYIAEAATPLGAAS